MATDARGHTVPTGSDFAQRKSLADLSLSIPSIKSVASESAATLYLAALSDAGITPSVANPVWAWRSDTQALMRHDGAAWTLVAKSVPPATTLKQYNGPATLGASDTFVVAVSPWSGLSRAIVHYSLRIRPTGNAAGSIYVWDGDKEAPGSRITWHSDGTDRDQFVSGTVLMAPTIGKDIGLYVSPLGAGSSPATVGRATLQVSAY